MKIIYKYEDWEYDLENLEYMLLDEETLQSNRECRVLLSTYLDTDFGWCELFKKGELNKDSVAETFSFLSVDFDDVIRSCTPVGDLDVS